MEHDLYLNPNIVYIDGTKIEAYANKYTFVWKKAVLKAFALILSFLFI